MDELEQLASALLVLLVVVRLTREVRAALEPIPRWPAGTSAADADGTWVTPDEERDRWAKRGAPPGGKRLATSVTAAAVALMAIPAWVYTVWVRRAPLPLDAIASASRAPVAFRPPALRVVAFASTDGQGARHDADHIWRGLQTWADASDEVRLGVAVAARDGTCVLRGWNDDDARESSGSGSRPDDPPVDPARSPCCFGPKVLSAWTLSDDDVDTWIAARVADADPSCGASPDAYTLFLFPSDEASETLTMGAGRHAWARYPAGGGKWRQTGAEKATAAAQRAVPIAASYFTTGHGAEGAEGAAAGTSGTDALPGVSPSGGALLSFSLVNAAPEEGHTYSWRFEEDFEKPLTSRLVAALAPLLDARVEAQVLYHSPSRAATEARRDAESREFKLPADEAPHFVDGDWNLDTSPAELQVTPVHFVAYVPAADRCPLTVSRADGSPSPANGFVVPGWGGVAVWNPPTCRDEATDADAGGIESSSGEPSNEASGSVTGRGRGPTYLDASDAATLMSAFVAQLRASFGLPSASPKSGGPGASDHLGMEVRSVSAGAAGFARWEVDVLVRRRAVEATRAATDALSSLADTARNIPELDVPAGLAERAAEALRAADAAREAAAEGRVEDAAAAARDAHVAAESAFYHPDIISLLYFPAEYKLAIYIPLFLPTAFPVLVGLMWDVRFFVRRTRCAAAFRERRDTKVD